MRDKSLIVFLVLIIVILVCNNKCTYYYQNPPRVDYNDIQGAWKLDSLTFSRDSGGIERIPCNYIYFTNDSIHAPGWDGYVFLIGKACERGAAKDHEVVNIWWIERGDTLGAIKETYISIEEMKGGDTLIIGNCISINCYVNQFGESDECYTVMDTLIRMKQ
jgi:hypothetical protein